MEYMESKMQDLYDAPMPSVFDELRASIQELAGQVILPRDNTFTKQLKLLDKVHADFNTVCEQRDRAILQLPQALESPSEPCPVCGNPKCEWKE